MSTRRKPAPGTQKSPSRALPSRPPLRCTRGHQPGGVSRLRLRPRTPGVPTASMRWPALRNRGHPCPRYTWPQAPLKSTIAAPPPTKFWPVSQLVCHASRGPAKIELATDRRPHAARFGRCCDRRSATIKTRPAHRVHAPPWLPDSSPHQPHQRKHPGADIDPRAKNRPNHEPRKSYAPPSIDASVTFCYERLEAHQST